MTTTELGLIHIQEADFEEIQAQHVDFFLTIKGLSLITGDAALNKAREVQQLVMELKSLGVTDKDIKLLGVQADVSTGILGRNSSAKYSLKVHCERLESIPDFLGVITSQKNISITYLKWNYGDLREVQGRLLDRCIERANTKAKRVAQGLNVIVAGVHRFEDRKRIYTGGRTTGEDAMAAIMATPTQHSTEYHEGLYSSEVMDRDVKSSIAEVARVDLAMQISHSQLVVVGVNIDYRIAPSEESA